MNQSTIHYALLQLNRLSREVLDELESESCRMEQVRKLMDQRSPIIRTLINQPHPPKPREITDSIQSTIEELFDSYEELEKEIRGHLNRFVNNRREALAAATKQRKAEDGYHLLGDPDISYFKY